MVQGQRECERWQSDLSGDDRGCRHRCRGRSSQFLCRNAPRRGRSLGAGCDLRGDDGFRFSNRVCARVLDVWRRYSRSDAERAQEIYRPTPEYIETVLQQMQRRYKHSRKQLKVAAILPGFLCLYFFLISLIRLIRTVSFTHNPYAAGALNLQSEVIRNFR